MDFNGNNYIISLPEQYSAEDKPAEDKLNFSRLLFNKINEVNRNRSKYLIIIALRLNTSYLPKFRIFLHRGSLFSVFFEFSDSMRIDRR